MSTPRAAAPWMLLASILVCVLLFAETPPASQSNLLELTATTANVAGAPDSVRIEILRWSADEERDRLLAAWNRKPNSPGGRGGSKGAAKGTPKGPVPGEAAPATPEAAFAKALDETTTVGYLWSSEIAGYALRYAGKITHPDGSQRVVLITQRRLGESNQLWKPSFEGASNTYEFSVIELRLNAKDEGEGKISLLGKIALDAPAKMVTIENYSVLPAVLRNVRRLAAKSSAVKP